MSALPSKLCRHDTLMAKVHDGYHGAALEKQALTFGRTSNVQQRENGIAELLRKKHEFNKIDHETTWNWLLESKRCFWTKQADPGVLIRFDWNDHIWKLFWCMFQLPLPEIIFLFKRSLHQSASSFELPRGLCSFQDGYIYLGTTLPLTHEINGDCTGFIVQRMFKSFRSLCGCSILDLKEWTWKKTGSLWCHVPEENSLLLMHIRTSKWGRIWFGSLRRWRLIRIRGCLTWRCRVFFHTTPL